MKTAEKAVREAAAALHDAIAEAKKAGLVVAWPHRAEGLTSIAISETAKATGSVKVVADPVDPAAPKVVAAAQKAADKALSAKS